MEIRDMLKANGVALQQLLKCTASEGSTNDAILSAIATLTTSIDALTNAVGEGIETAKLSESCFEDEDNNKYTLTVTAILDEEGNQTGTMESWVQISSTGAVTILSSAPTIPLTECAIQLEECADTTVSGMIDDWSKLSGN